MRYAAFLRGVSPMNLKMPDLQRSLEGAGFTRVVTLLSSGNAVFDARATAPAALERKIEAALRKDLGISFPAIVRPIDALQALLASDPWKSYRLSPAAKRVVTFLRTAAPALDLPIERDGARILRVEDGVAFSAYEPTPKGPVFMTLIERAFGKDQTTRTWQTVEKVASR